MPAMRPDWAQVFGLLQGVPAVIALAQAKSPAIRTCAGVLIGLDAAIIFGSLIGLDIHRAHPVILIVFAAALVVLPIAVAVKTASSILGTLLVTGGALEVLGLLEWVR